MSLASFSSKDLLDELNHRLRCTEKETVTRTILIGPPGCGKGTQSARIKQDYCVCHLSTGDLLRAAVRNKTPMGMQAKKAMDSGALVSDDIVTRIVADNINSPKCSKGFILDGFPRNLVQAQKLDDILAKTRGPLTRVINLKLPDSVAKDRIGGRLLHPSSGRSYHRLNLPPKVAMRDDITGEPLIQRKDDQPETAQKRLDSFYKQTSPVIGFYEARGLVSNLDAQAPVDVVYSHVQDALGAPV